MIALRLFRTGKPLSVLGFAFWPTVFLMWAVGALVLIAHGSGIV